jgi:hypothetical protein
MVTRTLLLIPVGAIVGACIFAWAGCALHDATAKAQPANTAGTPSMSQSIVGDDSVVIGATDSDGNVIYIPARKLIGAAFVLFSFGGAFVIFLIWGLRFFERGCR